MAHGDTAPASRILPALRAPRVSAPRGATLLCAQELLDCALTATRSSYFSDFSFVRSLECLVNACNEEANLSPLGARFARIDLLRCLKNLLRFEALETACPEVLSRPIHAPVFITGMPRSGTTFLHQLITQDPNVVAPRLFQLVYPYADLKGISTALRKTSLRLQLAAFRLLSPQLHALHPIAVDAAEECTDITAQVFQSPRFESTYRVPSYRAWVRRSGFLDGYRFHRRFLQHLDAKQPGHRWVLKSPDHVFALDDLRKVYPDARLIFVHRDPVRVLASVSKLTEALRRPFSRDIDRLEIGREVTEAWLDGAQRMSEFAATEAPILHVHYRDIIDRPLDVVHTLYRFCDLPLSVGAEERMWNWLGVQRSVRHRSYDLEAFGLDARSLRERFKPYTTRFGIELEDETSSPCSA
jgi:hypothetical protein